MVIFNGNIETDVSCHFAKVSKHEGVKSPGYQRVIQNTCVVPRLIGRGVDGIILEENRHPGEGSNFQGPCQ